jgi:hypothetical protein
MSGSSFVPSNLNVRLRLSPVVLLVTASVSCAPRPSLPGGPAAVRESTTHLTVHGSRLTLHLADPGPSPGAPRPLVVYGSGDGGWFGAAVGMFRTMAAAGYPVVGVSSRALLKIEQAGHAPLSGRQIAESYRAILDAGRQALALPADAPAVLTGWSRGASLAVLAAAEPDTDRAVTGIVAIGLPRDEHLDLEPGDDGDPEPPSDAPVSAAPQNHGAAHELLMYPLLEHVAPRRTAIVQASGDRYLPAAEARRLFGSDSTVKRFFEVRAGNHRFGGGKDALRRALLDALAWAGEARQ